MRTKSNVEEVNVEEVIANILWDEQVCLNIQGITVSPGYIIPAKRTTKNSVSASFYGNNTVIKAPLCFSIKNKLYHLQVDANWSFELKQAKKNNSKVYLPLELTQYRVDMNKDGKLLELSPFPLFGIHGAEYDYPIILAFDTKDNLILQGIYENNNDVVFCDIPQKEMTCSKSTLRRFIRNAEKSYNKASQKTPRKESIDWRNPKSIVKHLDDYVIGQESAKRTVAVSFSNYMLRKETGDESLPKENIILIGPSGVGKTLMINELAKQANLPIVKTSMSGKSSEGYVGESLSVIFADLKSKTNEQAPYALLFLDEFDKLAGDDVGSFVGFGSLKQDALIGWVEEAVVFGEGGRQGKELQGINTKNILFVAAGAFQGGTRCDSLESIIQKRLVQVNQNTCSAGNCDAGRSDEKYILEHILPEDIIKYGLKPELVGRFPSMGVLHPLTTEDKIRILKDAKHSSLARYNKLFELRNYKLTLTDAVLKVIARQCPPETGARALTAVCNNLFTELLFDPEAYSKNNRIHVTSKLARELITLYA